MDRESLIAELDALLGAADGSDLDLTPAQVARVREIQALLEG